MNIKISGDTIIWILLKKYDAMNIDTSSSTIGIDDFSFKKRHNYGTSIVDERTHNTIAILDGRDGKSLLKWLKENKHIVVKNNKLNINNKIFINVVKLRFSLI